ncbi:MAG: prolyl oligopeptidase family serine peptidase [Deltaproteobacteria bacterium]|nr:prolyl oligopeptidase family serine peptidase [Deltaproteobacteria bacterium]MDE0035858.1 prolyl oligopeptidase family serine peptidase [Deltaproteobacteria bacterium]
MSIRAFTASILPLALLLPLPSPLAAQDAYRIPPADIVDILEAAPFPQAVVSPSGDWMILAHSESMPGIEDLAAPMLRLAGRRISPVTNGMHAAPPFFRFSVVDLERDDTRVVTGAEDGLGAPMWSPSGDGFAFTRTDSDGVALWLADPETGTARALTGPSLNGARGEPCSWMPDGAALLCHFVPEDRGAPPEPSAVPVGPVIQESGGEAAPSWTFQDLLEDAHDEALFDYYLTSQPAVVEVATGAAQPVGAAAVYESLEPSPSGEYFLSVRTVRPYSYLVPDSRFAKQVEVLGSNGRPIRTLATLPLDEGGPEHLGFRRAGLRQFSWRAGAPAVLTYIEALDGGDPGRDVPYRDRVLTLAAPFDAEGEELIRTEDRLGSGAFGFGYPVLWGGDGETALVYEFDWPTRRSRAWIVQASSTGAEPALLWDRSTDDWYGNPGDPVMTQDGAGKPVVRMDGTSIFLAGPGGSPEGDRPFLDRLNLETAELRRLFHSGPESYETVVGLADAAADRIVIRHETSEEPPNYHLVATGDGERTALTSFPNPQPQLAGITKSKVYYERDDGIPLSAELYLPAGYEPGERLPVLVWAYPREYADEDGAGQVRGSAHRFTTISGASHLLLLTQGYAVLNDAAMPIVGGFTANDTYVEQLVANGRAAVDKLVELGVADRDRVGIAGHSYGAFMTANMLAHSDDFAAGIARSGAFNRSLTPFGFQYERRTFWEAPEVYFGMSAFMHAEKINEPLLLTHGVIDNNSGTFPVQSERMYHAVKGLGGTVRLVMLPHESHGYRARESVLHTVWEMFDWMRRHVRERDRQLIPDGG